MKMNNTMSEDYEKPILTGKEEIEQYAIDIFSKIDDFFSGIFISVHFFVFMSFVCRALFFKVLFHSLP